MGDTVTPPGAGRWQADRPINSPALRVSGLWPPSQSPFSNITGPRVFMRNEITITGSAWWNLSPSLKYCSHWPNTTRYHKYPHPSPSLSPLTPHTSSWGEFLTGHWQPYLARAPVRLLTNRSGYLGSITRQICRDARPGIPTTDTDSRTGIRDLIKYFSTRHISIISRLWVPLSSQCKDPGPSSWAGCSSWEDLLLQRKIKRFLKTAFLGSCQTHLAVAYRSPNYHFKAATWQ